MMQLFPVLLLGGFGLPSRRLPFISKYRQLARERSFGVKRLLRYNGELAEGSGSVTAESRMHCRWGS